MNYRLRPVLPFPFTDSAEIINQGSLYNVRTSPIKFNYRGTEQNMRFLMTACFPPPQKRGNRGGKMSNMCHIPANQI